MPRLSRIVGVGLPHHITQRGNYQQNVFLDDEDRKTYLSWVNYYSEKYYLSVLSFCLMQNHVHFIVIPHKKDSLAKVFNAAHMRYSQYFNKKLNIFGHLWQGRFYSCILDEAHLIAAVRYVERNPVRANIVKKPWEWEWSSALTHIDKDIKPLIKLGDIFNFMDISPESWKQFIDSKENISELNSIRKFTTTGRPLGAKEFLKNLENKLGKRLIALPVGRPRQDKNKSKK